MPTAIVTGGARGLGRVYCLALAGAGFDVVVADLLDTGDAVDEIEAAGGRAIGCRTDISSAADTEALAAAAAGEFGTIDVLINNAAFYSQIVRGPFHEVSQAEWDKTFEVNVRGTWLVCCAVYPYMKEQGSGKIINIASTTCFKGTVGFPHYVTSKTAIIGLTRCLAAELGPDGITVNTVSPDLIPNPSLRPSDEVSDQFVVAERPLKRTQVPEDMVGTILYLAGRGSDFVTGQNIVVNGGAFCQ
ncbi:MAG: SDR family oxidoreductase [Acidimicrobiaceae bacterium]|nr:SDR family oxidoreductase [Acidimicrobiaceae bacterium]MXZ65289.1 SDR family oxidoreductase [Acidimicrobiaceae bacterium]MYF34491.1 SDR family oxidoreductase [Acidimicrobiaceae bacterium]MYG79748.1 SDR family oxidoreductase [Acidimicrobiaceae bacterium]MYJ82645.1 SDR family oxidoreductase [Acidimicrobiaceae bacterium]